MRLLADGQQNPGLTDSTTPGIESTDMVSPLAWVVGASGGGRSGPVGRLLAPMRSWVPGQAPSCRRTSPGIIAWVFTGSAGDVSCMGPTVKILLPARARRLVMTVGLGRLATAEGAPCVS